MDLPTHACSPLHKAIVFASVIVRVFSAPLFLQYWLCTWRLDLVCTCTPDRVLFIVSMSNRWEQELQQSLDVDLELDATSFISPHPEIAPHTIRRCDATVRGTLLNCLKNREPCKTINIFCQLKPFRVANHKGFRWRQKEHTTIIGIQGFCWGYKENTTITGSEGGKEHMTITSIQGFRWGCKEHTTVRQPRGQGTHHNCTHPRGQGTHHNCKQPRG